jgi:hypothetical protein
MHFLLDREIKNCEALLATTGGHGAGRVDRITVRADFPWRGESG